MQSLQPLEETLEIENLLPTKRFCFVCTGNTCRSPMAEAIFNRFYAKEGKAFSAGLYADGSPISEHAKEILQENGIHTMDTYRSKQISEKDLQSADEIIAISRSHARQLTLLFPLFASKIHVLPTDIPDPYGQSLDVYRVTYLSLKKAIAQYLGKEG